MGVEIVAAVLIFVAAGVARRILRPRGDSAPAYIESGRAERRTKR
jgi:hypothetical protein